MSEVKSEQVVEKKSLIAQLEEEGDVAADYLEGLLDIADLDGDIDIDVENDRAALAIAGGKLTGYRKMAERIVDLVAKKYTRRFDKKFDEIKTKEISLSGGTFKSYQEVQSYTDAIYNRIAEVDFNQKDAEYLVHNYGKQTDIILQKFDDLMHDNMQEKMLKSEVWFTINHEMTCSPTDFFMRRTGRLFFDIQSVFMYKEFVLNEFKNHFSWDEKTTEKNLRELEENLKIATTFE